ncbi:eukaryotic translation initiation factor 3 subunit G-like [Harmonia axyridis]|uniref:eukaryotic translation initiation factor 3 subunit G-like n=1 Tax=Harmonia axyridis TaxID=115357 RepID=UPI001E276573|nr:eukaryotic translation initiation factor 3 subunit G-like [Harmonia axyridis]
MEELKSARWADEVELEGGALPPSTEVYENDMKILTEYKYEGEKKVKIVRTYKVEKRVFSKSIAVRKTWKKFGESSNDKPGPNPATTIVAEDVYMQYITNKEEENKQEDDGLDKLKALGDKNVVKCRLCSGDHWTSMCPWKATALAGGKVPDDKKGLGGTTTSTDASKTGNKYIPPSLRGEGGTRTRSENVNMNRRDDATIRISNLSEDTTEQEIEELVKDFGPIHKLFLAKEKTTQLCKGFGYIHFKFRNDAANAINVLNGFGHNHLILDVEWSKPQTHNNNN